MPFVSLWRPSLQIGLLSAIARGRGFPVETFHLNLEFAADIGGDLYQSLCLQRTWLIGDWLFSGAAFGEDAPDPDCRFLDTIGREPDYVPSHLILSAVNAEFGNGAEARTEAAEVLRINPRFTLRALVAYVPLRKKADLDRYVKALRKAGIPE